MKRDFLGQCCLADRKLLWVALSDLYLDTELQDFTISHIARVIYDSPFTLEEAWIINKEEVFPVLKSNLVSTTGIWTGFREEWLLKAVEKAMNENAFKSLWNSILFKILKGRFEEDWDKISNFYRSF